MNILDFAQLSARDQSLQFGDGRMKLQDVADHEDPPAIVRKLNQLAGFCDVKGQGFFDKYVLSVQQRLPGKFAMQYCRRGNHNRLNRGVQNDLIKDLRCSHTVILPRIFKSIRLRIAYCLKRPQFVERTNEVLPPISRSDDCYAWLRITKLASQLHGCSLRRVPPCAGMPRRLRRPDAVGVW